MKSFDLLRSSLTSVDRLFGGGYGPGHTTIVGTVSGGGKTILSMQFAFDFIQRGNDVLVLTSDQPAWQLVMKLICRHLNLDFSLFTGATNAMAPSCEIGHVILPYVPSVCWSTPQNWDAMMELRGWMDKHLRFIDWDAGGEFNLEEHFEFAVEDAILRSPGWNPVVIIVDGLNALLNEKGNANLLWRAYQRGADTVIRHCRRHGRAGFITTNLNCTLVTPTTTVVTHDMVAECKTLTENADNFLGVTALRNQLSDNSTPRVQFFCSDQAKYGSGGKAKVIADFKHQRFSLPSVHWLPEDAR